MLDDAILLWKLRLDGCSDRLINWFTIYLHAGFKATIDGSKWRHVSSGVSEGSVLGTILFSIMINDIAKNLKDTKYHIYADDLQIYVHCYPDEIASGIEKLQSEVVGIIACATGYYKCIIFGSKTNVEKLNAM